MSLLQDLIAQVKEKDFQAGMDLEREFKALASRRQFGLNFERHRPEAVELPQRPIRKGDKVRVLPPRGETKKGDERLWVVKNIDRAPSPKKARLEMIGAEESKTVSVSDLIVVAEFRDTIYPGLVSTGRVVRGGDKPFHTVINAENYHALKALSFTHRGKVDVIYIDPPYNSGARDWKYNNDYVEKDDLYRHSKWLAMMERRLLLAKELLNPSDSVLIVTIDEKEYLRLGLLLEQTFPQATIQMISSQINPKGVSREGSFRRSDEYIFFLMFGISRPVRMPLSREWSTSPKLDDDDGTDEEQGEDETESQTAPDWTSMMRRGSEARRVDRLSMFYPIYADPRSKTILEVGEPIPEGKHDAPPRKGLVAILPLRRDGSEGRWQLGSTELLSRIKQGRVRLGRQTAYGYVVNYLPDGAYAEVMSENYSVKGMAPDGSIVATRMKSDSARIAPTQWKIASHNASENGSTLLDSFIPKRKFPFPKSLYAVEDALRFFVKDKKAAVVLDFFSGSGTTAHAVMRLNRQDCGVRQCISVTNNEVAPDESVELRKRKLRPGDDEWEKYGVCDYITKPRIEAAITGRTPSGEPIKGEYRFIDPFPMAEGFSETAEFFTLTYETPVAVSNNLAFSRVAPLLWLRAGSTGRRIDKLPPTGWDVTDTYALLVDLDHARPFTAAVSKASRLCIAYIVTDDERRFQAIVRRLPSNVEPVRLYESYLTNFSFASGE